MQFLKNQAECSKLCLYNCLYLLKSCWFSWHIKSLLSNFPDVNPKIFRSLHFPFKLFVLKIMLFLFFLLENLTIIQSFCLILWQVSRSPSETRAPVRDKAWHIDSSSCVSWIFSSTGFISIISLGGYCGETKVFLCNFSVCLERGFVQFFDTSSSDSTRYIFQRIHQILKLDLQALHELRLLLITHLLVLPCLVFFNCFLVRTTIFINIIINFYNEK